MECAGADEQHFCCDTCFDGHVAAKASEEVRRVSARGGLVPCPTGEGCTAQVVQVGGDGGAAAVAAFYFSEHLVARHVCEATWVAHQSARDRMTESRVAHECEASFAPRLAAMEARLQGERCGGRGAGNGAAEEERVQARRRHVIEHILNLSCPRCHAAFVDFSGCYALTCHSCSAGFCAYCLKDCGADAHEHIAKECEDGQGWFGQTFASTQQRRRKKALAKYLRKLPDDAARRALLLACQRDLADLGINARALPGGADDAALPPLPAMEVPAEISDAQHKKMAEAAVKMNAQHLPPPPVPDRIQYADEDAGFCARCRGRIVPGEPRVGSTQPWARGMGQRDDGAVVWGHLECVLGEVETLEQLRGWDRCTYSVVRQIRDHVEGHVLGRAEGGGGAAAGADGAEEAAEAELREGMEAHEALQDAILRSGVGIDDMVNMLESNGIFPSALRVENNGVDLAVCLADGLANGCAENCPECGMASLVLCAGRVKCWNPGDVEGFGTCEFERAPSEVRRFRWRRPSTQKVARDAMSNWLDALRVAVAGTLDSANSSVCEASSSKRRRLCTIASAARSLAGLAIAENKTIQWALWDV